jgi:hypothetical protein
MNRRFSVSVVAPIMLVVMCVADAVSQNPKQSNPE